VNPNIFVSLKLIFERKKQTTITLLGVAIGVTAFIVMTSLMKGFQKYFLRKKCFFNWDLSRT